MQTYLAAAIQMVSTDDRDQNLADAQALVAQAAQAGARLVVLPENFAYMGRSETLKLELAEQRDDGGPMQTALGRMAADNAVWIVGGTIPLRDEHSGSRAYAACLVYDDQGRCVARYDKIHLFDVAVAENGEQYRESARFVAGGRPAVVDTPFGRLGLSVCYDLRFPELYRTLVEQGAELLTVPSAFTQATGQAHWEILIRARAVENLCYVIAPNQGGRHANGRETWGHSVVISPWGQILASQAEGPGVVIAEIDRSLCARTRAHFPCLDHRRL